MSDTDSYEDLVKCGYLDMKLPRKHRKFGLKVWRPKWFILRRKSSQGQHRLECHKSEEACLRGRHKTIITLQTLVRIETAISRTHSHVFKLIFEDTALFLSTENETDLKEWMQLIKKLMFPGPRTSSSLHTASPEGTYPVTIVNTDASERLGLAGEYLLSISPEHLQLYKLDNGRYPIQQWGFDDIPRFRLQRLCHLHDSDKIFIINLARSSQTGDSEFQFLTPNGRQILENVKYHTRRLHRGRTQDDSARSSPLGPAGSVSSCGLAESRSRSSSSNSQSSRPPDSDSTKASKSSDTI